MRASPGPYDVAIVGAGPAGCASALAFARRGARVLLLEADPRACERLAGEWLHPPALSVLDSLGVELVPEIPYATGKGFVVFPDDGSEPIALPYAAGRFGLALEHALLVETLRAHCRAQPSIELVAWARATRIEGQALTYECRQGAGRLQGPRTVQVPLIVGASGRAAHGAHGLPTASPASSRMAGVTLDGCVLPFEGYLHVLLGGPGPVLAYRIDARRVRVLCDVPLSLPIPREGGVALYEAYASVLPFDLREPFGAALREGPPSWAMNELRPRVDFGREGLALVGDAVGSHHPLAASGLTFALEDAAVLATSANVASYRRARARQGRVAEMIAVGLYEVLADDAEESVAMRRAIYELWRERPDERLRSMGLLSGEERSYARFGHSFLRAMLRGSRDFVRDALGTGRVLHTGRVASDLGARMAWLVGGTLGRTEVLPVSLRRGVGGPRTAEERYGAALRASSAKAEVVGFPPFGSPRGEVSVRDALARSVRALLAEQAEDGSFESEVRGGPDLAAQYVIAWHSMGRTIPEARRAALLRHFECTRNAAGLWGAHGTEPTLAATVLVYVALRLLGLARDDPRIAPAYAWLRAEGGAVAMPASARTWLAIAGLCEWEGVSRGSRESWFAPRWLPMHPSRHAVPARLLHLGTSVIGAERWHGPITPLVLALREEIFPRDLERVDAIRAVRSIRVPWSVVLDRGEREHQRTRARRAQAMGALRERIRHELRASRHVGFSPTSALLHQIALHIEDPDDPELVLALERFESWVWEDEVDGARLSAVRTATWDTSLAVQALAAAALVGVEVGAALRRAEAFVAEQQIVRGTGRERGHDRTDPAGGFCLSGAWHGWPSSLATAEAMLARLAVGAEDGAALHGAACFLLRCQDRDGGFGAYERARMPGVLEWLGRALGFFDGLGETASVETTAASVAALASVARRGTGAAAAREIPAVREAVARGVAWLRRAQRPDGAWPARSSRSFVYATMAGVRGLLAAGVPPGDPQVRRACTFLKERQRSDGAWGEHPESVSIGRWVEHERGRIVPTAWALSTLLDASDPDFGAIERAAHFLLGAQHADGGWPAADGEGACSHDVPLEHGVHRFCFPIRALARYEARRADRARFRRAPLVAATLHP